MASLIDELIDTLNREDEEYNRLIALSREKTPIIVKGDLEGLAAVTDKEQAVVSVIQKLEKDRMSSMKDIAEVTGRKDDEIKLLELAKMMDKRPEEQSRLTALHDKLKGTMDRMKQVNEQNRELLQDALDMVQFEMNLLQSLKTAPETADYNSSAYATGTIMGSGTKRFDAKQ